jgi:hypothetical protein
MNSKQRQKRMLQEREIETMLNANAVREGNQMRWKSNANANVKVNGNVKFEGISSTLRTLDQ